MKQWYIKELGQLAGVSVQALHHYDRMGLLVPSLRLSNGYRLYSETDLQKLQQIIALKFFGFELSQIKILLSGDVKPVEHFAAQIRFLEEKANALNEASRILKDISAGLKGRKSIPWKTILNLIQIYHMTQEIENSWVKEIFTPSELKQYAAFQAEWKNNSTPKQKAAFEKNWADLVAEIGQSLQKDPNSSIGAALGEKCMKLINAVYGKKYAHLRTKKFERGFGEGKGLDEVNLTPEMVNWLDKAVDAYWRKRIYGILDQLDSKPSEFVLELWNEVLDDMYGYDNERKKEIYGIALADKVISSKAKNWLRSIAP